MSPTVFSVVAASVVARAWSGFLGAATRDILLMGLTTNPSELGVQQLVSIVTALQELFPSNVKFS